MGFTDFVSDAGLTLANNWFATRSYVIGDAPSQADVVTFKAFSGAPDAEKYPHVARWYKHIASHEADFATLPGDASKPHTTYGPESTELPTNPKDKPAADDDDDMDLFGSDDEEEEDPEVAKKHAENLAAYQAKKAAKGPKPAAKSIVTLEVKPWDDETNLEEMEANVRAIEKDGLVWSASKWVAIGYGIKKLQINLVVEDEKISLDELQQEIEEDEDHVQSTDIAAMQKL
ncbi:translation elongation factor 1 subunit beta [Aspergillus bombycis]|uniref:Elongation factor 1-beta n=1 Tax=Aspergillus bombycis TaxID=109264 RepID=A0A1F7ZXY6_9EURO|nr:translation elongation factor 1 subunit beta [Aspergillus bombycis]OGM44277.1 translation elongation factor 1 subunit beta [Aspergillus bombycis]